MKTKRLMCVLMACVLTLAAIIPPAGAADASSEVIWLEDLEWEWIDLSAVEYDAAGPAPLTSVEVDKTVSAHSVGYFSSFMSFKANDVVAFNCSYSPSSANMDFGVVSSTGKFHLINVKGGSISQTIGINQAGNYAVAVRNNSSQTVRVVGFVNY